MLEMNSVSTSYGTVAMLRDVSLQVRPGEMVCLLGPNGAGKSTTFNAICGLLRCDSGAIRIAGRDVRESGTERLASLGVGFVPEGRRLFPTLTVRENLRLPLELNGVRGARADSAVTARLEQVGLADRGESFPDQLSGGEQQRVAIARALVHDPLLLLADEPTGNLDGETGRGVLELLARLVHGTGRTLVMVTHSSEAEAYADRCLVLVDGRLQERERGAV